VPPSESLGQLPWKTRSGHIRKTLEQTRGFVAGPNGAAARWNQEVYALLPHMQKLGISRTTKDVVPAQ